jgi:uncharacterized protein (DUF983 family)
MYVRRRQQAARRGAHRDLGLVLVRQLLQVGELLVGGHVLGAGHVQRVVVWVWVWVWMLMLMLVLVVVLRRVVGVLGGRLRRAER